LRGRSASNPLTDENLVSAAQSGEREAFAQLVRRYEDQVFTMSLRMLSHREDARDLAQEIFLTVYESLAEFRGDSLFKTWIYRITVNRCRDELRRRRTVKHTRPGSLEGPDGVALDPPGREPTPEAGARGRETEALIADAMERLPAELREIIVLRDVQDLAYEEMAGVLGVPVGTVRSRLNRARSQLAELLEPILKEER
jgi:RNA polymerase sigma-70 factor (ECF subfamily)